MSYTYLRTKVLSYESTSVPLKVLSYFRIILCTVALLYRVVLVHVHDSCTSVYIRESSGDKMNNVMYESTLVLSYL